MPGPTPAAVVCQDTQRHMETEWKWEVSAQGAPNQIMGEGFKLFCHLSISLS